MRRLPLVVLVALLTALAACSSGSDQSGGLSPHQRLAQAKTHFDQAHYIKVALHTDSLPSGTNGLLSADGTGTHAPAFTGTIQVKTALTINAPVVAVSGKVYAKLPFVGWNEVNPADYGAPNPAQLMDTSTGISSLFTQTRHLSTGSAQRSGGQVLTPISGILPGSAVKALFPSSGEADYHVTYLLTDDNEVVNIKITGPFYGNAGDVTYSIDLDLHATPVHITPPS